MREVTVTLPDDIADMVRKKVDSGQWRGTMRDDLRPSLRMFGFRRRVTIAFTVAGDVETVLRVFYGGRNFEAVPRSEEDRAAPEQHIAKIASFDGEAARGDAWLRRCPSGAAPMAARPS